MYNRNRYNFRKKAIISDINITPFVDVLLVLLVIFMITVPVMTSGIKITLPKGGSNPSEGSIDNIYITIKSNNNIFLQDKKVIMNSLAKELLSLTKNDLKNNIFVRADKSLDYGEVVSIVNIVNNVGFKRVVLITELDN